jgi:hypothetical protein
MKTNYMKSVIGIGACIAAAGLAYAAVTIDDDGFGFVGKGDVQNIFGWNNNELQANADNVQFRLTEESVTTTEASWTCDRDGGDQTQERSRTTTTTTTTTGVLSSTARVRNQITGFNLNGYSSSDSSTDSETEGPPLGSCPTFWTAGPVVEETFTETFGEGLQVSGDGGVTWYPLEITPPEEL